MKKSIFTALSLALVFTFLMASCSGKSGGGGKSLNSPEALKEYLDKQPANGPDKPIKVSMGANELMLPKIAAVLKDAGKYVSLNLSGNALTSISEGAFRGCETLVGINIPNSVTSIGSWAFINCTSLTSITIPNSVTSIGSGAFSSCFNLTSITIPDSVTSIGSWAFDYSAWLENQSDGLVYAGKVAYKYKGTMPTNTSIQLLNGTKGIASAAFQSCETLVGITIPNSVTSIGSGAFSSCFNLTSITIPDSVTSIGSWAFSGTGLTSVTIPNSVTSIGSTAFDYCFSVKFEGTIPSSGFSDDAFPGDLRVKYLAGGVGTYTTTTPKDYTDYLNLKWTKK